jgi:hypothetical protein
MVVAVRQHSIVYRMSSTYHGPVSIPIPASALYAQIFLVPLRFSSHLDIRIFEELVASSMVLASAASGYAFDSVCCLFTVVLSIYHVDMIRK